MQQSKRFLSAVLTMVATSVVVSGCASGSLASEGAEQGGKSGALGGAVAGAVGSLIWGGGFVENVVAGTVVGAASGAAMGGAAGASEDKKIAEQREMSERDAALQQKLGPDNFEAAKQLALCKHKTAIGKAKTAYGRAQDNDRKRYALMIEAIANKELGNTSAQQQIYPLLLPLYGEGGTTERVDQDVQKGESLIQTARTENGQSATCE